MDLFAPAEATAALQLRERHDIPDRFKWNLSHIFPDWADWQAAYDELERKIGAYAALQGTLAQGADRLLAAMKLSDDIGQLTYKVWYFAVAEARRGSARQPDQRPAPAGADSVREGEPGERVVQSRAAADSAADRPAVDGRPTPSSRSTGSRIEDLYRQQEHVLDEKGEHLLSLSSRFSSAPNDAYAALSTADVKHPTITLSTGPRSR